SRDMASIVGGLLAGVEVRRPRHYRTDTPQPYLPLPQVVHEGEGYRLMLEVVPDPLRDVVLVNFKLAGEGTRLYVLLAPHLGNSGLLNSARAGSELLAWN